jgi:hypothetical protein
MDEENVIRLLQALDNVSVRLTDANRLDDVATIAVGRHVVGALWRELVKARAELASKSEAAPAAPIAAEPSAPEHVIHDHELAEVNA